MKNLANVCIIGSIVVLVIAVIARLIHLQPLLENPVPGLLKVAGVLLLTAIAIGVNK